MENTFHAANRYKLEVFLNSGEAMLFFSGKGIRKTADENYPYFTNRNFLYLTGVMQENSALLLINKDGETSEQLFVEKPDFKQEVWTGRRFTEEELESYSGIKNVDDIHSLTKKLEGLLLSRQLHTLWLCMDPFALNDSYDRERKYAENLRFRFPELIIKNSYPALASLRRIKTEAEIKAIRKAIELTGIGIRKMMSVARPGIMEYQLEAEFNYTLSMHGQRNTAFPSIISAGLRNFYLHYALPMCKVDDGDLILTDVGAPYENYCADISRVFPANGKFSKPQKQLYQIAYDANRELMAQIRPGVPFSLTNKVCREVSFQGLKKLGLISDYKDIGNYVWHGTTHHIGLDTHDVGGYDVPIQENMVFTVDAGIYVRQWGIGLRIEDNVLVTAHGCENLSASIPAGIEEIEDAMSN